MISIKKICLLGVMTLALVPVLASAQTATSTTTIKLIADVNITAHSLTINGNAVAGSFTAMSSLGNQDVVYYGLVMRSKEGTLIGATPALGKLSLVEKVPQSIAVDYKIIESFKNGADVYLNLSNASGIILATVKIGELAPATTQQICTVKDAVATCKASAASELSLSIYEGGAQGALTGTTKVSLPANQTVKVSLADLMGKLDGGHYLIGGSIMTSGQETDHFALEYVNAGTKAKILSVSVAPTSQESGNTFKAIIYTSIVGYTASTSFALSLATPGCGDTMQSTVAKGNVTELSFTTSCASGTAEVTLLKDGSPVDTLTSTFSLPGTTPKNNNFMNNFLLIVLVALSLGIVVLLLRKHHGINTATGTPTGASAGGVVAAMLLFATLAAFAPTQASAATAVLTGGAEFYFCSGGCGSTQDPAGGVTVSTTVTYPSSVPAGSQYSITFTQQNNSVGNVSSVAGCQDSSSDSFACDSLDLRTTYSINGTAYSAAHVSSKTTTLTAGTSGSIPFSATVNPWAPYLFGCDPVWMTPTVKCMTTYDTSANSGSVNIPITAAPPTVDVHFSLLQKMFSAFALAR